MTWRVNEPGGRSQYSLRELWNSRELLVFLAWRDFKVRYKQTALGAAWAVLQPLMMLAVITLAFGRLARISSDGIPYPLFAYAGLILWQLFASAFAESSNSVVAYERLLTKVAFPRLVIPLASVATSISDAAAATVMLAVLFGWYGVRPSPAVFLLPLFLLLTTAAALAIGIWLAALNVRFRDVRYAIPFLLQPLIFVTPVAYPTHLVPEQWRFVYGLNPMVGIIEAFRWALFGVATDPGRLLSESVVVITLLLAGALPYFRRSERAFADFA